MVVTVMAHVCESSLESGAVEYAAKLADRLSARLIGVGANFPPPVVTADFGAPAYMITEFHDHLRNNLAELGAGFRKAAAALPAARLSWRGAVHPPVPWLAAQARAADLIVTGAAAPREPAGSAVDPADIILTAGRPVIVAPDAAGEIALDCAVLAWKDAPQARRAARDALPLLKRHRRVIVCGIGREAQRDALEDVAAWLTTHKVAAETLHDPARGAAGPRLRAIAAEQGAGLIVAGAYGHSRIREWALGGVTRDLLKNSPVPCLFSH